MATKATFSPRAGVLSVFGDNLNNSVVISRDAVGNFLIDDSASATNRSRCVLKNVDAVTTIARAPSRPRTEWPQIRYADPKTSPLHETGASPDSMPTGSASPEGSSAFKQLVLVCVCAIVGIMLTAAAVWFGFDVYGGLP